LRELKDAGNDVRAARQGGVGEVGEAAGDRENAARAHGEYTEVAKRNRGSRREPAAVGDGEAALSRVRGQVLQGIFVRLVRDTGSEPIQDNLGGIGSDVRVIKLKDAAKDISAPGQRCVRELRE